MACPSNCKSRRIIGRAKKLAMSKAEIRRLCKEYAEKYIAIQREEFKRLGVLGDWEQSLSHAGPAYEAQEIRELGKIVESGALYRKKKPVYWCASCVTASGGGGGRVRRPYLGIDLRQIPGQGSKRQSFLSRRTSGHFLRHLDHYALDSAGQPGHRRSSQVHCTGSSRPPKAN